MKPDRIYLSACSTILYVLQLFTPTVVCAQHAKIASVMGGPGYHHLKYSISFADHSQMAYDGTELKSILGLGLIEGADRAFYNGHYGNASSLYKTAAQAFPESEATRTRDYVSYRGYLNMVDTNLKAEAREYYTSLVNTVAILYQVKGKYQQALELFTRALDMRGTQSGKTSREYLNSLHNIAVLKKDLGYYDESERIFNYLLPAYKKLYSANSRQYVLVLNNRAMLLAELGRTREAISSLDEAIRLGAVWLHPGHIDLERIITNRALLEQESGDPGKADSLYKLALSQMEAKGFDDHPDYNNVLIYYASLKLQRGEPDAIAYLSRVTDKIRDRYGERHILYSTALGYAGDFHLVRGDYERAAEIYRRIISVHSKVIGERHKDHLQTLVKLAVCLWHQQNNSEAASLFRKAIKNYLHLVNNFFPSMSESEKSSFWRVIQPGVDSFIAFAVENGNKEPALLTEAYDLLLQTKGIILSSTRQTQRTILSEGDALTNELYGRWLAMKSMIIGYYASSPEELSADKVDLDALEAEANDLEKKLSLRSAFFRSGYAATPVTSADLRAALADDEVAIEILRVDRHIGLQGGSRYTALVLKKNSPFPLLVNIGPADSIETQVYRNYIRSMRNRVEDRTTYLSLWKPLEETIGNARHILFSADGVFMLINPATFRDESGNFLADRYSFRLMTSTREILSKKTDFTAVVQSSFLVGCSEFGNETVYPPLPGTRAEISAIDSILSAQQFRAVSYVSDAASETNVRKVTRPPLMHIATHAFFYADVNTFKSRLLGIQVSKARENPLLRAGLLFQNSSTDSNDVVMGVTDNGLLSAYEAADLDLNGTFLVTLSACETGLGEVVNGEGVYGLSRAFQVAGADKVMMSLWKVDDHATSELMILFYKNLFLLKDPDQALAEAQRTLRITYPDPYYWGAFVLLN